MTQNSDWHRQRVLITGCCGTVGSELFRQLALQQPAELIGVDSNESALFFQGEEYRRHNNIHLRLCDIRDRDRVTSLMRGVDTVLHAAALKHVILCEEAPTEAVQTNILGTQNIIHAAIANQTRRVLFTSSDKAVNPTNVMGTSKLMAERLITAANVYGDESSVFTSTRFGNVLGSSGSVIPLFRQQIATGGPVTLTDDRMTRFIMTLEAAVSLVLESVFLARGGEVFVTKMPIVRIADLARVMIDELAPHYGHNAEDIAIEVIGSKPGEKLYEELLSDEETRRTVELERYFSVLPAFQNVYSDAVYDYPGMGTVGVDGAYNSDALDAMSVSELRNFLLDNQLLSKG